SQSLECRLNTDRFLFQHLHDHFQCQPHRSAGRPLSRVRFLSQSLRIRLKRYQPLQRHQGLRRADCTSLFYLWIFLSPGCHLDTSSSISPSSRPFSISTSSVTRPSCFLLFITLSSSYSGRMKTA